MYSHLFKSFLAQTDGQALPYAGAGLPGLRLVSPSEHAATLKQGISVLSFTLPGFSFDRREAVVFLSVERQESPEIAPEFSGELIYLKRTKGDWVLDKPDKLPGILVVS